MASIPVTEAIELSYSDSGAPATSKSYVTLVLIHGTIGHKGMYELLFPYASKYNLRLVPINLRDYAGSTPNTKEELDDLGSDDPKRQAKYIKGAALQIGMFLGRIIDKLKLPPITEDKSVGGIAVLGWSSGTLYITSLLAHAEHLPQPERETLSRYLRTAVIFDPAWFATGHPVLPAVLAAPSSSSMYSPFRDTTITDAEKMSKFISWVSSYYDPPVKELSPLRTEQDIEKAIDIHSARSMQGIPTLTKMSQADMDAVTDSSECANASSQMLRFVKPSVYKENYLRGLTIPDGDQAVWPRLEVLVVWCELSVFEPSWAVSMIHDWLENGSDSVLGFGPGPAEVNRRRRNVRFEGLAGANHFGVVDEPESMVRFLSQYI